MRLWLGMLVSRHTRLQVTSLSLLFSPADDKQCVFFLLEVGFCSLWEHQGCKEGCGKLKLPKHLLTAVLCDAKVVANGRPVVVMGDLNVSKSKAARLECGWIWRRSLTPEGRDGEEGSTPGHIGTRLGVDGGSMMDF